MDTPNGRPSLDTPSLSHSPSPAPPRPPSRPSSSTTPSPSPLREDCWTEDATFTLVGAWGHHYLALNRGNLRQPQWQEVADAVSARHSRRTDIQCKNRIDTLKKKYKLEKARVLDSNGTYTSAWPFFSSLDALIGSNFPAKTSSSSSPATVSENQEKENPKTTPRPALNFSSPVPVRPRSSKRTAREQFPSPLLVDDSNLRRRIPAVEKGKESSEQGSGERRSREGRLRGRNVEMEMELELGFRELAEAVERLGDIYERVEKRKQREMLELEKVRMEFAKDLEEQRMRWFVEMQLHLHKMNKKSKGLSMADAYSWMAM